ncbi:NAD(P)-dependent alcohol dehydrogenase [Bacteroidota bacterium]
MKAIVFHKYGSLDSVELIEVEKPSPKDNEVLVKVHAASVNSWDWDLLKGIPFANRVMFGLFKPKSIIIGCDIAGRVEKVGSKVNQLQTGDEILGDLSVCGMGGFAEYVCAPEDLLALKPEGMTFEEAAALPHTGLLALQGLRDKGHIQKGQKVLINGAGGGSGTFAVQIAKLYGAEVTCVDRSGKFDMLHSIGADHVIDFTQEDFTKNGQVYDLILDVVTHRSILDYKRSLSPTGIYVMLGGGNYYRVFQGMVLGPLISMMGSKKMSFLMHKPNKKDLNFMTELFEDGKVIPFIDRRFALSEVAGALRYYGEGKALGKVVITVSGVNSMV